MEPKRENEKKSVKGFLRAIIDKLDRRLREKAEEKSSCCGPEKKGPDGGSCCG